MYLINSIVKRNHKGCLLEERVMAAASGLNQNFLSWIWVVLMNYKRDYFALSIVSISVAVVSTIIWAATLT